MSISPIDSSISAEQLSNNGLFEDAVKSAQESPEDAAAAEQIFEEGVGMMMQTVLLPRMNEILSEAMSDE